MTQEVATAETLMKVTETSHGMVVRPKGLGESFQSKIVLFPASFEWTLRVLPETTRLLGSKNERGWWCLLCY